MLQVNFETFKEIAVYLQNTQMVKQLDLLQKMNEKSEIYVPLIGQFSAGKSNILNNLLGKKILPTMSSETTAYSTFISYGGEEAAYVMTKNGNRYDISLDILLQLSQKTIMMKQNLSELLNVPVANGDIESVHVRLQHPILQNGLVFVDTPGLNTLIQTHENRTQALLPQANAVIYVLGKSLTDSDRTIIQQIDRLGIDIVFVRTKLDEVKESEGESVNAVLTKDIHHLRTILEKEPIIYGVTNDPFFLTLPEWEKRIEALYDFLSYHVAGQVAKLKEKSISSRLLLLSQQLQTELQDRKQRFTELKTLDSHVLEEQVQELERQISILQAKMENQYGRVVTQFRDVEFQIHQDIGNTFEKTKTRFINKLNECSSVQTLQEESETIAQRFIGETTSEANRILKESVDRFIKEVTADSNGILAEVEQQIDRKQPLSLKLNMEVPTMESVFEDVEFIEEKLGEAGLPATHETFQQLERLNKQREHLEEEMFDLSQQKKEVENDRRDLGGYQPQYKVEQSTTAANILGKLGMAVDIALLFIPATSAAKGAQVVAKGASVISKTAQAAKVAKTTVEVAQKASKAIQVMEKVKDALYVAKQVQDKLQNHEVVKSKPGLLDMVTVEFWFRKAGELLDGPPKYVEDEEYRQQFMAVERELNAKYEAAKQEELNRLQQLNLITTREERLKKELEIENRNQQRKQQEMQLKHNQMMKTAREKQVSVYRNQLIKQFNEALDSLHEQQKEFVEQFLAQFIQKLPTSISMRLQQEVNSYRQQLHQAIETKQADEQETAKNQVKLEEYIAFLQKHAPQPAVLV